MSNSYDQIMYKTLDKVSETGEVTYADVFLLRLCKKEKTRATQVPNYKQLLNGAGEVVGFVRGIIGGVGS